MAFANAPNSQCNISKKVDQHKPEKLPLHREDRTPQKFKKDYHAVNLTQVSMRSPKHLNHGSLTSAIFQEEGAETHQGKRRRRERARNQTERRPTRCRRRQTRAIQSRLKLSWDSCRAEVLNLSLVKSFKSCQGLIAVLGDASRERRVTRPSI